MEISQLILRIYLVCVPINAVLNVPIKRKLSSPSPSNTLCDTMNCHKLGQIYSLNLNPSGNSCTDFYDYACHNWGMHNPLEKGMTFDNFWSVGESMNIRALRMVEKLLENGTNTTQDFERARAFHKEINNSVIALTRSMPLQYYVTSSMGLDEFVDTQSFFGRSDPNTVANIMKNVDEIPFLDKTNTTAGSSYFPYWEIDRKYIKIAGESAFFDVNVERVGMAHFTALNPPVSAYGSLDRVPGWSNLRELAHYKAFLISLIRSLGGHDFSMSPKVLHDIDDVILFREKLDAVINQFDSPGKMERMSIKGFQELYIEKANSTAQINWLEMIRATYKNSDDQRTSGITETSMIFCHDLYFVNLAKLLRNTPERIIGNHIHLYFAERHVAWDSDMKIKLTNSVTRYGSYITGVIRNEPQRWQQCIEKNPMPTALGKAYASEYFSTEEKLQVQGFVEIAKELLQQEIFKSPWLDLDTKQKSRDRVKRINSVIGYPDFYETNRPQMLQLQSVNPFGQEMYYSPKLNRITASAAMLQWPRYNPNMPFVINYGATVSTIGHELQHAVFYNDDVIIDANGKASRWPKHIIAQHKKRMDCFKAQYGKYNIAIYNNFSHLLTNNLTFTDTVEEDVADVMGLKLAYLGYKQELKKHNGICQVLPGFESFSCEKLFFLAFANLFCANLSQDDEGIALFTDTHSLPQIRVNGAVGSMKEFSDAFNCQRNDPLYFKETCDYWNP